MNYYNPYFAYIPYGINNTSQGLLSRLIGSINFKSIISGTQKTLNFMNQLIPVVKQVSPIVKNAKTMFNVMNEFKKADKPKTKSNNDTVNNISETKKNNAPTFFI